MMPDTQASHPAITIARYIVGAGSVVGFVVSMWFVFPSFHPPITPFEYLLLGGLVGYLLVTDFCLRRWVVVERREAIGACKMVLGLALILAAVGTSIAIVALELTLPWPWVWMIAIVDFGFWMLWGFVLASVIRKLRRMKRVANAE